MGFRYSKFCIVICLIIFNLVIFSQENVSTNNLTTQQWREDLRYRVRELETRHGNIYKDVSKEDFKRAVDDLSAIIPNLSDQQIIFGFARLGALIKEGHTGVFPFRNNKFGKYPIEIYPGEKGWFIIAASPEYSNLIGATIKKIEQSDINEAFEKISPGVPRDNLYGLRQLSTYYLTTPEFLVGSGISQNIETLSLTIEDKTGNEKTVNLKALDANSRIDWKLIKNAVKLPLWLKNRNEKYWFTHLKDKKSVYFQFNSADISSGRPRADFFDLTNNLVETIRSNDVEKLIIDLRWNAGGSYDNTKRLLNEVIRAEKINKEGSLFVITSPYTFSAASAHALNLEEFTEALFVGEPMAGKPAKGGELRRIRLPNSSIEVRYSAQANESFGDLRPTIFPQLRAPLTVENYRNGEDPAFEVIFNYVPSKPIMDVIRDSINTDGVQAAIEKYKELKTDNYNSYDFGESQLNRLGYELINAEKIYEATAIFKLNSEEFGYSANVYDSLAEVYQAVGKYELAIENYKKAFSLDKRYSNVLDKIRELREKK